MLNPPKLRILVVDDHAPFRRALVEVLARQPDFEVVAEASNGAEAVRLTRALRPHGLDLVLMDIDMPVQEGISATAEIKSTDPDLAVVMLTVSTLDVDFFGALRSGAVGFLSKNLMPMVLVRTLRDFQRNGALPMSRQTAARMLDYFRNQAGSRRGPIQTFSRDRAGLTPRENEVLAMIANGAHDREIASTLHVAETTVKTHVKNVLRKLHARNRTEAAAGFYSGQPG
jgi:DNA-binding NarL/FixJ family response regulator